MDIQENICPKCGGPSDGGLCSKCRAVETTWLEYPARVVCTHCPTCGSLKQQNTWTDCELPKEQLIENLVYNSLKMHEDLKAVSTVITSFDPSPNRTSVKANVRGKLYGVPVEEDAKILIIWSSEQCDRCSRYSGGYYAGTIQVRAEGRKPDDYERSRVIEIANKDEDEVQKMGERLSFVTDFDENKDGIDVIVSSHNLGEIISRDIVKDMGGKVTRHPKLIGEKNGRPVYRITYLVRLPRYHKGDVFENNGRYFEIRDVESTLIKYFDLIDGSTKYSKTEPEGRLIGNVREAETAYINYINGDIAGILDPKTYENLECIIYGWLELYEGEKVRFLRDKENDRIVFTG